MGAGGGGGGSLVDFSQVDGAAPDRHVGRDNVSLATIYFMDGSKLSIQISDGDLDYTLGSLLEGEEFPTVLDSSGRRVVIRSGAVISIHEH